MANNFISASFVFTCSNAEMALLEEAFQAESDLMADLDPGHPSPEFLEIFPPTSADPWSGFRSLFGDPDFPAFGAEISGGNSLDTPATCKVYIYGETEFQPEPIANLIHRCCQATLKKAPIAFQWAETCSKPLPDEFGGGWCAIFPDWVDIEATHEALAKALEGGTN